MRARWRPTPRGDYALVETLGQPPGHTWGATLGRVIRCPETGTWHGEVEGDEERAHYLAMWDPDRTYTRGQLMRLVETATGANPDD